MDRDYTATIWVKGETATVLFSTKAGAIYGPDHTITSEWQQVRWDFVANHTSTSLVWGKGTSQATFYID